MMEINDDLSCQSMEWNCFWDGPDLLQMCFDDDAVEGGGIFFLSITTDFYEHSWFFLGNFETFSEQ